MATNPHPVLKREVDELRQLLAAGHVHGDSSCTFVRSLLDYFDRKNFLTDGQLKYFDSHLERARRNERSQTGANIEEVFDGKLLRELLFKAKQSLKYPSLRVKDDDCGEIVLYVAGHLSKTPGFIVINNGKKYPHKVIYGSIDLSGHGSLRRTAEQKVKSRIRKIAKDPIGEAKLSGQKYSYCCFCNLELTSPISLHHGYGPICASKWGLPWTGPELKEDQEKELAHIKLVDLDTELGEGEQT